MAPLASLDVNVYNFPHKRMKELVSRSLDMMTTTNFSDVSHLQSLLLHLLNTFKVLKAHEQIENRVIMSRLKEKLRLLSITNSAVCHCHSDNHLVNMLHMFKSMYRRTKSNRRAELDKVNVELKLRRALDDFTQTFVPHMNEEEEIFQPLLEEHFSHEELREIKDMVMQQHLIRLEMSANEAKLVEDTLTSESSSSDEDYNVAVTIFHNDFTYPTENPVTVSSLPDEVLLKVMSYLDPRDLVRSSEVCHHWNRLVHDGRLWTQLYPICWANDVWTFDRDLAETAVVTSSSVAHTSQWNVADEDTDINETFTSFKHHPRREEKILQHVVAHLMPSVGWAVTTINLSHSVLLSSTMLYRMLMACKNIELLDASYTHITDSAFKCMKFNHCARRLRHLDLSGCVKLTSITLVYLSYATASTQLLLKNHNELTSCIYQQQCRFPEKLTGNGSDQVNSGNLDKIYNIKMSLDIENIQPMPCLATRVKGHSPPCSPYKRMTCATSRNNSLNDNNECWMRRLTDEDAEIATESNSGLMQQTIGERFNARNSQDMWGNISCLEYLSLSGCHKVDDSGLWYLIEVGGFPHLTHLDLSGCPNVTRTPLTRLLSLCPHLDYSTVFYCDNILDVSLSEEASGCQNVNSHTLVCCRTGLDS